MAAYLLDRLTSRRLQARLHKSPCMPENARTRACIWSSCQAITIAIEMTTAQSTALGMQI